MFAHHVVADAACLCARGNDALDAIASNEALDQKKTKVGDISTDGPAVAKALREHAEQLRKQAEAYAGFETAEMVTTDAAYWERLTNQALREGT